MNGGGNTLLMMNESDLEKVFERLFTAYFDKMTRERESEKHDEVLLSETEVQKMLNVTHATLWRWNNTGYLHNVKIGRRCLWRKSDIDALMNR